MAASPQHRPGVTLPILVYFSIPTTNVGSVLHIFLPRQTWQTPTLSFAKTSGSLPQFRRASEGTETWG